ncbi:glycosyltransferase [Halarcobacter sp.]|uniref:glycosyltransferase n=1 Tax=Halarcobacter sp. TaxID=2321133 RepID=UPI002AA88DE7|nr:glycosyltransferase [Halarcobacter sp.]
MNDYDNITISVIVSVYKDTEALDLILNSLLNQTIDDFEIIISEDCESSEMQTYLKKYKDNKRITHLSQKDDGWKKNIALNKAVRHAKGDYLIFIDGDIIPYRDFVEKHKQNITHSRILCGKRVELGSFFSKLIRKGYLGTYIIEKLYWLFLPFLALDKARHIEEGLKLKKDSSLEKKLNKKRPMIIGCNFSCFKKDLEFINGFDEDYTTPSVGEDIDLTWRFQHFGIDSKSVRYLANTFHLYHPRTWNKQTVDNNNKIMKQKWDNEEFICYNGLIKKQKEKTE